MKTILRLSCRQWLHGGGAFVVLGYAVTATTGARAAAPLDHAGAVRADDLRPGRQQSAAGESIPIKEGTSIEVKLTRLPLKLAD